MTGRPATAEEWEIRCRTAEARIHDLTAENHNLKTFSETTMAMALRWQDRAVHAERALSGRRTKSPVPTTSGRPARGARGRDTSPPAHAQHTPDDIRPAMWAVALTTSAILGLGLWKAAELIAQVIA